MQLLLNDVLSQSEDLGECERTEANEKAPKHRTGPIRPRHPSNVAGCQIDGPDKHDGEDPTENPDRNEQRILIEMLDARVR